MIGNWWLAVASGLEDGLLVVSIDPENKLSGPYIYIVKRYPYGRSEYYTVGQPFTDAFGALDQGDRHLYINLDPTPYPNLFIPISVILHVVLLALSTRSHLRVACQAAGNSVDRSAGRT